MPPSHFQQAIDALTAGHRRAVEVIFTSWLTDDALSQVGRNVAAETALSLADFLSLLTAFAMELGSGDAGCECWARACHGHVLRGHEVPRDQCPAVLGRVRNLKAHADSVAQASFGTPGCLSPEEARRLLLKHSGSLLLAGFEAFLRAALLGHHVVWATFNPGSPDADPFDNLPRTRAGICTALGLGDPIFNETLVLLVWSHADSGSPPLRRPTVADAGHHQFYRPCADPAAPWGFTEPLRPNLEGLRPQPEVVMAEIPSRGLRLPFQVLYG